MLEVASGVPSFTNVRKSKETGHDRVDNSDEVDIRKDEGNLSKVNPSEMRFFTSEAKVAFIYLRKAYNKLPIFYHFDLKCYIRIEIDVARFAISKILSELTYRYVTSIS